MDDMEALYLLGYILALMVACNTVYMGVIRPLKMLTLSLRKGRQREREVYQRLRMEYKRKR